MPETEVITQLPGVKVLEIQRGDKIIIRGVARPEPGTKCPRCEAESFRIKSSRWRSFKHAKWERQLVFWQIGLRERETRVNSNLVYVFLNRSLNEKKNILRATGFCT